jgi:drug/metabolite transporter (DMT)-like permease
MIDFLWVLVAVGASMLWGLVYVLDKKVLETFSVIEMMCVYYSFSAIGCWVIFAAMGSSGKDLLARLSVPVNFKWMAATVIAAFLANLLILRSIQLSNATLAAIVEITYPLFTVAFAYALFKANTLNWDVAIGGTLIFAGVLWIGLRAAPQ